MPNILLVEDDSALAELIASYLQQTGRGQWMPAVWVGVFLAAALALLVGGGLELVSAEFPQKQQELFEGIVGLVAVGILSSMVFWMRKVARSIKHSLHQSLDHALAGSRHQVTALILMVFFAVAREGLETVFFLLAVFQQSEGPTAPIGAISKLYEKTGWTKNDVDLWEINEAFAVVAEKFIRDLDLPREKVNINGGAMALGHPIGATGSILIGTMVDELERRGGRYGLVTMCAAGGMAPAIIVERVDGFVD